MRVRKTGQGSMVIALLTIQVVSKATTRLLFRILFGAIFLLLLVFVGDVCLCSALIAVIAADKCVDVVFKASAVSQVATSTVILPSNCCRSASRLLCSPPSSKILAK